MRFGPTARPRIEWGLNRNPSDSEYNALWSRSHAIGLILHPLKTVENPSFALPTPCNSES